jgi:quercetin dioxygenase-like cupin family protein
MPNLIEQPTRVMAAGNKHKEIAEYVGRLNSATEALSIAHMKSPAGWSEPGQIAAFDEYSVVLRGTLRAETRAGTIDVKAGQAILTRRGEWVRYSTLEPNVPSMWRCVCRPFLGNSYVVTNEGIHEFREIAPDAATSETHTTVPQARKPDAQIRNPTHLAPILIPSTQPKK